jgi:thiol-disulfide isomerase/thioredoxin
MSFFQGLFPAHREAGTDFLPSEGRLPPFEGASGWLNSEPLTPQGLRGRHVVAVQFWTYTCVNWLRTLPYVREWAIKYHDHGLSVIGVHTPEFGFERDVENVKTAAREMRVNYPIALDSNYALWRAFDNHYWPALYIADEHGVIRYHHFGEGEYAMSEMVVQQLLGEAGKEGFDPALVSVEPQGTEVEADWSDVRTPETYLAYGRSYGFASVEAPRFEEAYDYPDQSSSALSLNEWAPSGLWTLAEHASVLGEAPGRIAIRFHARDVNLVMGPAERGTSVRFRVLLDGEVPGGAAHGTDVDEQGNGTVGEQRLYQLIRQEKPIFDRLFEIEFLESGVEAYCFTFG